MDQISRIGMHTSKHIFQLHGVNAAEAPVLRKKLRRKDKSADELIRNRTQLTNSTRGYAAEFGLTAAKGRAQLVPLLERIKADEKSARLGSRTVCHPGQGIHRSAGPN